LPLRHPWPRRESPGQVDYVKLHRACIDPASVRLKSTLSGG
jgi:hypothetical protein